MGAPQDRTRSHAGGRPAYALGHSERELQRLSVQARLVGPITRRFFTEAGIGEGMRVLDVGSGAGDVAFLAAELVGATGEVVGTDRSGAALAVARERAKAVSQGRVTFQEGDPTEMVFERPFDAVVGRYVLMFQADPAASLGKLAAHVRPGGIVVFHEPYRDNIRSYPSVAVYDHGWELVDETLRRSGADPLMGIKLHSTFLAAGLPAPTMRMESVIAGGATSSDQIHFEMDLVRTLASEMERLGIATGDDFDAETLPERVFASVSASDSVIVGRSEVGAWARLAEDGVGMK
jgi:SAM-dependent methyltransferase